MIGSKRYLLITLVALVLLTLTCDGGSIGFSSNTSTKTATPRAPVSSSTATPNSPTILQPQQPERINLVATENGGHIVSATDETSDNPASNLIDGCKTDYCEWWTNEPPKFPQVIVFGFVNDQVKTIDEVVLNPWTSEWRTSWVKNFEIYVSDQSSNLKEMRKVGAFTLEDVGIDQSFTFDAVPAKYVALVVKSHYGNAAGISLNEFEVYAASGSASANPDDLVAASNGGRIVAFSSEDATGSWSPDQLIDGDKESPGWSSAENLKNQFVVFAFQGDKPRTIDRVILNLYSAKYHEDWIKDFELRVSETSPDPQQMKSLGRFKLEQVDQDQQFAFAPVQARYIALVPITNYGGTAFSLNEFEAYAAQAATTTGFDQNAQAVQPSGTGSSPIPSPNASAPQTTKLPGNLAARAMTQSRPAVVDNIEVSPSYMDLVPILYHLYGNYFDDLMKADITNHSSALVKLRVESAIPDYTETAIDTFELAPGESATVVQDPPLLPNALDKLQDKRNAMLHLKVDYIQEGQSRLVFETTAPMTIYARGDFPWGLPDYYNGTVFLATMVTPNDPSLDGLLRAAADYHPDHLITFGYGAKDDTDHGLFLRMKAIYQAVSERYHVTYVATGKAFVSRQAAQEGLSLQRLKLPYEVLDSHSGMCVETSLLFASAFEKILLDPVIITRPGHVYVAVPISQGSSTYYVLETTLVSRGSFEEAIRSGAQNFHEDLKALSADENDEYFWLDVKTARAEGLVPIPWR